MYYIIITFYIKISTLGTMYTNILSGGEITSPAENLHLTGMYLQQASPNTNAFDG